MSENSGLKQTLSLFDLILFGVGGVVGAGIYAIIGEAAAFSGNLLWASFLIAAVVALLTSLSYAEFVSRYPDAGGSFEFVKRAFGPRFALVLSVVMFLTGVVAPAAIAISFSEYLSRLIEIPSWMSTTGIVVLMVMVNAFGMRQSSWFNNFATIVTIIGLGAVILFAAPSVGEANYFEPAELGYIGVLSGGALIFFSYVGFEDLVKMAEEAKDARKNLPKALIISGIIVLILYLLIAICAVSVMSAEELAKADGPLAAVMRETGGETWATILIGVALFATSKTILSNTISTSRLMFDVARDNDIPYINHFEKVDKSSGTPRSAIFLVGIVVIIFALIGDLKIVASLSNIFVFTLFIIVNIALIRYRLKYAEESAKPAFQVPINIGKVPFPTILALIGLILLFGFNIGNMLG
ncbi:APC family permease [Alteromonas sp. H39]|uniref:APC family permease n=1 Tax=Alteromonas sp. H39 TaxID=3389876 RepID=UPI0039E008A5